MKIKSKRAVPSKAMYRTVHSNGRAKKKSNFQFINQKDHKTQYIYIYNKNTDKPVDLSFVLDKHDSNIDIFIFIIQNKLSELTLSTTATLKANNISTFTYIKAVLYDNAQFNHTGLIKILKSGNLANAYLSSKIILAGDKAFAQSKPYLEIEANDVKASHGSTVGRMSEEELFYLKSRGLFPIQAQNLLIEGFFEEQILKITSLTIQKKVRKLLNS